MGSCLRISAAFSQSLSFDYLDAGVVKQNYSVSATTTNGLAFASSVGAAAAKFLFSGNVMVPANKGYYVNGIPILTGDSGATVNLAADAGNLTVNIGNQTSVHVVMKGLPTTCTSMQPGELWNNSNVINICP